jgi:hypothetical protein
MAEAQETVHEPGRGPGAAVLSEDDLAQLLRSAQS